MKKLYAILFFLCTFQTMMAIVLKDGFDSSKSARWAVKHPNVAFVTVDFGEKGGKFGSGILIHPRAVLTSIFAPSVIAILAP
jgi:hypothetical protein